MTTKHQKFDIDLKGYTPLEREAIAIEVINKIVKRTQSGVDKEGNSFPGYTKEYEKQKKKITSAGTVNLTLTEDMLDSLQILKNSSGKVTIGYEKGSVENAKADGNIRGTYGQNRANSSKARDFLGISESELSTILKKYPKQSERSQDRAAQTLRKYADAEILSGAVEVDDLDG